MKESIYVDLFAKTGVMNLEDGILCFLTLQTKQVFFC